MNSTLSSSRRPGKLDALVYALLPLAFIGSPFLNCIAFVECLDDLWVAEKFQTNLEIAGSLRNSFRASVDVKSRLGVPYR